jgi:hypothetical protein
MPDTKTRHGFSLSVTNLVDLKLSGTIKMVVLQTWRASKTRGIGPSKETDP